MQAPDVKSKNYNARFWPPNFFVRLEYRWQQTLQLFSNDECQITTRLTLNEVRPALVRERVGSLHKADLSSGRVLRGLNYAPVALPQSVLKHCLIYP
jgi:hypothetical protein